MDLPPGYTKLATLFWLTIYRLNFIILGASYIVIPIALIIKYLR